MGCGVDFCMKDDKMRKMKNIVLPADGTGLAVELETTDQVSLGLDDLAHYERHLGRQVEIGERVPVSFQDGEIRNLQFLGVADDGGITTLQFGRRVLVPVMS